ncbi:MAG: ABC transporter ATP-binding protein [Firmicutes bacterium]|nr:ABC transporter ATP-binding protein [Bacillota bacterium]
MRQIVKKFPGLIANDHIDFHVRKGEIHALLGENGAGKSTLMSVLFGLYTPEEGEIIINGQKAQIKGPRDANRLGIGMVHQHFKLVHNFTVLQNIILGVEDVKGGLLQMDAARAKVMALSQRYGLKVDPDALIEDISVGQQQRVEILKMLYRENDILIFDEPTAVLTPQEIEELMQIMRGLIAEGKSIVFITHKLKEIKAVADRCTVLRRGKCVGTVDVKTTSIEEMSEMMVGRKVAAQVEKAPANPGEAVLEVENLCVDLLREGHSKRVVNDVSLKVRRGEIVCVAGVDGNGQSELVQALTGLLPAASGRISLLGQDLTHASIRHRNTHGISHVPEDRHRHGLVLDYRLDDNLVLQRYFEPDFQSGGFIRQDAVLEYAEELIERFDIRSSNGPASIARSMSGGNQQKAIVARELDRASDLLIAMQPTRGLDVGAIEYIHKQLVRARDNGEAVLLVSFELDEVLALADRILVVYEGEIVGELLPDSSEEFRTEIGLYMAGSKRGKEVAADE